MTVSVRAILIAVCVLSLFAVIFGAVAHLDPRVFYGSIAVFALSAAGIVVVSR